MLNALVWNLLLTAGLAILLGAFCHLPWLRRRPALTHWLWLLLLVKLVTPPLIEVPLLPAVDGNEKTVAAALTPGRPAASTESPTVASAAPPHVWELSAEEGPDPAVELPRPVPADVGSSSTLDGRAVAAQEPVVPRADLQPARSIAWSGALLALSLLGTCLLATIYGLRAVRFHRWLERAGTDSPVLAEYCREVAASMGIGGELRSCLVDTRMTPLLWGWFRPIVAVPRQLLDEFRPEQLRSILAHELAHLVRRDHWVNMFVCVVKALMWWNPVVWWADRELRVAQEMCCDAIAIDRCGVKRSSYASTLLMTLDFVRPPVVSSRLALGMGSRGTVLRRFEMIGDYELSYRMSRWAILGVLVLGIPLICMPVRGQEEKPAVAAPAAAGAEKDKAAADSKPAESGDSGKADSIDHETRKLGEAVRKRLTDYSDVETFSLKDGETVRMKVKKNITPVAEIAITPHFETQGTKFDLEGFDAEGKAIEGTRATSPVIHDAQSTRMGLGMQSHVNGENVLSKIQLTPRRQGDGSVSVEVKALFTRMATPEEIEALLLTRGKEGELQLNMKDISRLVIECRGNTGRYPENLAELKKPLPKDVYNPSGEDYHYEAGRNRFILSSCGKDGVYGNDDDEIFITYGGGATSGQRHELYPLEKEETVTPQKERSHGERPQGNCSISGKVVSAETGKPVAHATVYLFYLGTHGSIFVNVASDGTFVLKDIPTGPHALQTTNTAGYQDSHYDPENLGGPLPQFSLGEGERRADVVFKVKPACRISGTIRDENGEIPEDIDDLTVLAWFEDDDGEGYRTAHARINRADGSYFIDRLDNKPAYVMAINWKADQKDDPYPPIYYPSTFSREDAKRITFDEKKQVENVDITLKKEGGLVLEGTVVDETGAPVPEAFVVVHRRDMLFDFVTDYTDEQGKYRIDGLAKGEFLVHVDAAHRGLVRMRTPLDLDVAVASTRRDFTLAEGVTISGRFVDEEGKPWKIGRGHGYAAIHGEENDSSGGSFTLTGFRNKYGPKDIQEGAASSFLTGEGGYRNRHMVFPTESDFLIHGMMPGQTQIGFFPKEQRRDVAEIRYDERDIKESGIQTKPGDEIKGVTIVIGKH